MKNKTILLLNLIVILGFLLAACSQGSNTSDNTDSSDNQTTALSQVNKLLVGTLKLEGTADAITVEQASQLLPLWQAYRSLGISQTAAEAEVDGLVRQIESTMTTAQAQAIKAMNLTNADMMSLMQSMGGINPRGTPDPNATPGADFPRGSFQSGDLPEDFQPPSGSSGGPINRSSGGNNAQGSGPLIIQGGPGIGGDAGSAAGLGGGQVLQGTPDPTQQARFVTQASQVNTMLLNVLITKLEALTAK